MTLQHPKLATILLCLAAYGCDSASSAKSVDYYMANSNDANVTHQYCKERIAAALGKGDMETYKSVVNDIDCKNAGAAIKELEQKKEQEKKETEIKELLSLSFDKRYQLYNELYLQGGGELQGHSKRHKYYMLIEANQRLRKKWVQKFRDNSELLEAQAKQCESVFERDSYGDIMTMDKSTPGECQAVVDYQREL